MDAPRRIYIFTILSGMLGVSCDAYAFRGEASVGVGAEYTDNATLVDVGEEDELTGIALLGFRGSEQSSALTLNVNSLIERRNYTNNVYDNETLFNLGGDLDWSILQDRFNWQVEDYYSQEPSNSQAPDTPNNRINTNVFSTGPVFKFRLSPVDRLSIDGRYSDYYFEDDNTDSERQRYSLAWAHALMGQGELGVTISSEDARFTETTLNEDFRRDELFGSYLGIHGKSNIEADLGVSQIDRELGEDLTGFLGRINWLRQLGAETYFEADAYSQYTDAGTNLLDAGINNQTQRIDLGNQQITTDVLYDERIGVRYRYGRQGRSIEATAFVRDEDYETALLDRKSHGLGLSGDRLLAPRITGRAYISYTNNDYVDTNEIQKDYETGLGLDYRLSRSLTLATDLTHNARNSDAAGADYDENRILLLLYYGADPYTFRQ